MTREEKREVIEVLSGKLSEYNHFYIADIEALNAEQTSALRRACFEKDVQLIVVKNTLFIKALEAAGKADEELVKVLAGSSSVMFSNVNKAPALIIKDFRKKSKSEKPILKAAFVEECIYVGNNQLDNLAAIKSREVLIGDIVALLQSPAKNVISALQGSAGHKVAGIVKTLEERQ